MYRFNHPSAPNTRPEQKPEQSNQSTTPGGISWKKALAIGAVPLVLLFGAAFQSPNSVPGQLQAIQAQLTAVLSQNSALEAKIDSLADKGPRKFYLTKTTHTGAQALSACAPGYHMASLREIFDTSNLRYDTDLGRTAADSGSGPPNFGGWIRTGAETGIASIAGVANCNVWTSVDVSAFGSTASPLGSWGDAGTNISPWVRGADFCTNPKNVWCVQD